MDKQTLEENIIAESHRPDKAAELDNFIRRAEDRIARSVRAVEMLKNLTVNEADRLGDSAVYQLPEDFLEDRTIGISRNPEEFDFINIRTLEKVAMSDLSTAGMTSAVKWYALRSATGILLIEFRGSPPEDSIFGGEYFAKVPRLVAPTNSNALLEKHESLYLDASLAELYLNTQDLELAQVHLDKFDNTVLTVNELAGRFFGGTRLFGRKKVIGATAGRGY